MVLGMRVDLEVGVTLPLVEQSTDINFFRNCNRELGLKNILHIST